MNTILELMRRFTEALVWWTVIQPWESALRVRLGRHITSLTPGLHFRIPYVDLIYRQTNRLRFCTMGMQTLSTKDNKTVILCASVGYQISDMPRLYQTLHHAEETIKQLAMSEIARFVQEHIATECRPDLIEKAVSATFKLEIYGLVSSGIRIVDFAFVRTYRILNESRYVSCDSLNTTVHDSMKTGHPVG